MSARLGHAPSKTLHPWPPTNALKKHPVDLTWNWERLRVFYGRLKATDIIYFNFQTYDPDVINWHLYEKVGCRVKTPDGRNYRFGVNDPPKPSDPQLFIYVPHGTWLPPDVNDELAKDVVVRTLYLPEVYGLAFTWRGVRFKPGEIQRVAELIAIHKNVDVRYRSPIPFVPSGVRAVYHFDKNEMVISFTQSSNLVRLMQIIHEASHVALDAQAKHLGVIASEGMAYIAECLFAMNMGVTARPGGPIRPEAWDVALAIRGNTDRTAADDALSNAIFNNRVYLNQIIRGQNHFYDGFA